MRPLLSSCPMPNGSTLNWIAGYIWSIADDVLRDVYVRGKYRKEMGIPALSLNTLAIPSTPW